MRTHYITYVKKNIESTHRKGTPVAFLLHILKYLGQRIGRSGGAHIPLFLMTKFASLVLLHNNSPLKEGTYTQLFTLRGKEK